MTTTAHTPTTDAPDEPAGQQAPAQPALQWAIVELMGHQRIAGAISQQAFGGANLVRIDVPPVTWINGSQCDDGPEHRVTTFTAIPAHTRSLGAAAIYGINWCDEATATIAAHAIKHRPVQPFGMASALEAMPAADRLRLPAMLTPSPATQQAAAPETDHDDTRL